MKIIDLVGGYQNTGSHEVEFDASGLSGGIYFLRLQSGTTKLIRKVVLMK